MHLIQLCNYLKVNLLPSISQLFSLKKSSKCSSINLSAGERSTHNSLLAWTPAINILVWYHTEPNKTLQEHVWGSLSLLSALALIPVSPILRGSEMSQPTQPSALLQLKGTSLFPCDFHFSPPYPFLPLPHQALQALPFSAPTPELWELSRLANPLMAHQDWQEGGCRSRISPVQEQ